MRVCCLCARRDRAACRALRRHLQPVIRKLGMEFFYEGWILAGSAYKLEAARAFSGAHLIIVILSADFLDSAERVDQLVRAWQRAPGQVVAVLYRACDWKTVLPELRPIVVGGRPDRDVAWQDVVDEVKRRVRPDEEQAGALAVQFVAEQIARLEPPPIGPGRFNMGAYDPSGWLGIMRPRADGRSHWDFRRNRQR